jgi:hypothetical protein
MGEVHDDFSSVCLASLVHPSHITDFHYATTMSTEQTKCNELVEQGKKALALSDWEGAVEKYAAALEIV